MKKLNITTLLCGLILFITSCVGSTTVKSVAEGETTAKSVAEGEVAIGNQVWTSKNLDVSMFRNGEAIPLAKTDAEWESAGENQQPAWCYYENKGENGTTYGKLYNWYAVNDPRGLAPNGYHIPTDAEWTILTDNLGEEASTKMKNASGWESIDGTKPCNVCKDWTDGYREGKDACKACANWTEDYRGGNTCKLCKDTKIVNAAKHNCLSCNNSKTLQAKISGNGTNTYGFDGLPGGSRDFDGYFNNYIGCNGGWWSSSENETDNAWGRSLYYNDGFVYRLNRYKQEGLSVRCLRGQSNTNVGVAKVGQSNINFEVTIGTQTWTTKNLNVSTYRNGDKIPQVQDKKAWAKLKTGAWCYNESQTAVKNSLIKTNEKYGKLYNWYAVNDPRGLAPKGYHIPSDAEWTILPIDRPEDFTKITGLEGGCRYGNGEFEYGNGFWWSISEEGNPYYFPFIIKEPYDGYLYELEKYSDLSEMKNKNYLKHFGVSVRCIKD